VTLNGGTNNTEEDGADPYTFKDRGAYFDGTGLFYTIDPASNFYLAPDLTVSVWLFPMTLTGGSVFSKSHASWADSTASAMFDFRMGTTANAMTVEITNGSTSLTSEIADIITDSAGWNFVSITLSFDGVGTTTITPVTGVTTLSTATIALPVVESVGSYGAVGARYVGNAGASSVSSYFHGFIYQISATPEALVVSTVLT
jgi:hypothetical protein